MKHETLSVVVKDGKILLGMKKRGFGSGKFNGFGGKVKEGESHLAAATRELEEECGIKAVSPKKAAELEFTFSSGDFSSRIVHVFMVDEWEGSPIESEEMKPEWFDVRSIPFDSMWADDPHWLPLVLDGKRVKAAFTFGDDNESIKHMELNETESFPKTL